MKTFALLLVFLTPFHAAAAQKKANPAKTEPAVQTAPDPRYCIFGAQSGKAFASEAAFKSIIWKNDVVYMGETHEQALDHQAQLEALKAMRMARGSKVTVGFEMLNITLQPILDQYAGGAITEEEFLDKADWKKEWGFDFALYKPLFDFIRENKLKALALNIPRKVVSKIARGGLESLDAEEKRFLPEKVEISRNAKYNEYLKAAFSGNPMGKMFTTDNYLASMAAWNESMGANLAAFLNANPGYAALVIAGNGHVAYNAAMPASVKARVKGLRQSSFYTEDAAQCPARFPKEHKDMASYIWYIAHPKKAEPAGLSAAAAPAAP